MLAAHVIRTRPDPRSSSPDYAHGSAVDVVVNRVVVFRVLSCLVRYLLTLQGDP